MLGHKPSEWIIDEPATIEHAGEKHTECLICGEVLSIAAIPQLVEKDRTDEDGNSKVGDFSILVTNSNGTPIFDSEISIDINDNVTIKLPKDRLLDYEDQTIITAINTDAQTPKAELQIFVYDENNNAATGKTDANGQLKVPNNKTSTGDNSGTVGKDDEDKKNTFVVKVTDKMNVVIPNCDVYIGESNNIVVDLPDGIKPTSDAPVIITVTDQHGEPKQGITVITLGDADYIEKGVTDMFGKITLPTAKDGFTDDTGKVRIDGMYVFVNDEKGAISNAFVKLNDDDTVSVALPDGTNIDYANRITVTVTDKDGTPLKDISVTVSDKTEKSLTDITDENGKIIVPPTNFDYTDTNGYSEVDGLTVTVVDKSSAIEKAYVKHNAEIKNEDGTVKEKENISVELPENIKFDYANRVVITVSKKADNTVVKDMTVIVSEKAVEGAETKSGTTDKDGIVILPPTSDPVKSSGGGSSSGGGGGSRGNGGSYSSNVINIKITDKDGKAVTSFSKSTDSKGNVTITLPNGKTLDNGNFYTITVTDNKGSAKADVAIILKDKKNNSATGTTDKNGMLVLPASEHKAYIFGYDDGTFRPDNNMSRAEAAAIFARLISEKKGENISGKANFNDISTKDWFAKEVGYLEKYGIIKGYSDNTFKPNDSVTRAEFVAMTVRFNALFNDVKKGSYTVKYTDVEKGYWAYSDIAYAKNVDWLNGYADGSFKGDNAITRAEVVTVVNRATNRKADEEYITKNVSVLNKFTDIRNNSMWYYADIMEAANTHLANSRDNSETWVK